MPTYQKDNRCVDTAMIYLYDGLLHCNRKAFSLGERIAYTGVEYIESQI